MKHIHKSVLQQKILLLIIFVFAAFVRFININWDSGYHLHPDERFLTMVGNAMKTPTSFSQYLNPATSLFNPANINYKFFVYGVFPLTLNKLLALASGFDDYVNFTLQGRFLSGVFDLTVIFLIYNTIVLLEKPHKFSPSIKYWACFLYATSVLPIQLSHFFAVDTFLNFFMFGCLYYSLKYYYRKNLWDVFLGGICLGLALASKLTAVFILPVVCFILLFSAMTFSPSFHPLRSLRHLWTKEGIKNNVVLFFVKANVIFFIFGIAGYLMLRISNPYVFERASVFDPRISTLFIENIKTLQSWEGKDVWFPPSVQWIHKLPVFFSLYNLALFGIGLPYFFFLVVGVFFIIKRYRNSFLFFFVLWSIIFFLYQSIQFVKVMRYFIFLYPFFAMFGAIGIHHVLQKRRPFFYIPIVVLLLLAPLMFISIYVHKNSRILASEWIYQNLPNKSFILTEHWDDPLPLLMPDNHGKQFPGEQLPVFGPDDHGKWNTMNELLEKGDFLIFSSNRGWGSIPTVPERYPLMTEFYKNIFAGNSHYKKIKVFTSYPSLRYLGIPIELPDDFSDESFTVYDHAKVIIFQKQ